MALNLEVNILGEYRNLTKATKGATKQLQGLQNSVGRISRGINATLATIGVGLSIGALKSVISSSVAEASNLEQAYGAAAAVFKNSSAEIITASKQASTQYGLSANQYLQSANLIGAQLSNLGFTQEEYTKRSQGLVALGADLAATFGGTAYDAVQALSAVFRGEYNQVERYGVAIRKSDINARVAAKGQDNLTGEMLKQAEALAALEILYGQTEAAQGQFARESDTLAGATQILKASFADAKVEIGEGFYPAVQLTTQFINDNMQTFKDLADAIGNAVRRAFEQGGDAAENFGQKIINTLTDLTDFLNGTADADNVFVKLEKDIRPVLEILGGLGEVFKGLIAILDGLVDGLFGWINLFRPAGEEVNGLAGFLTLLGEGLQKVGYWLGFLGSFLVPFTTGFKIAGGVLRAFSNTLDKVLSFVNKGVKPIRDFFTRSGKAVDNIAKKSKDLSNAVQNIKNGTVTNADELTIANTALKEARKEVNGLTFSLGKAKNKFNDNIQGWKDYDKAIGAARSSIGGITEATKNLDGTSVNIDIKLRFTESAGELNRFNNLRPTTNPYAEPDYLRVIREQTEAAINKGVEEELGAGTGGLTTFQKKIQVLIDTVSEALEDAKRRITGASRNFRDSVSLAFGVISNGAFAVFDVNRVIRQMQRIKDAAKNFAKDIRDLQRGGADQSLIDELLGMDPLSGSAAARGLLSSGRLDEFLALRQDLADIGAGAGGAANFGIYGTGTGGLQSAIEGLTRTFERGAGNTYNINVNNANRMTATEIVAAIKKYEKTTGKKVFS